MYVTKQLLKFVILVINNALILIDKKANVSFLHDSAAKATCIQTAKKTDSRLRETISHHKPPKYMKLFCTFEFFDHILVPV